MENNITNDHESITNKSDKKEINKAIDLYIKIVIAGVLCKKAVDVTIDDVKLFKQRNKFRQNEDVPYQVELIWKNELRLGYVKIDDQKIVWETDVEVTKIFTKKEINKIYKDFKK